MTDEEIIRNTVARYSHCLDDRRFKEWSETFTEDGVFGSRHGRSEIYQNILGGELATIPELQRRHIVTNLEILTHGDEADAISDLLMYDKLGEAAWSLRIGRYYDKLSKQPNGDWLFSERRLEWTGQATPVARHSVEVESFKHANPIPVASRIGSVLMSGVVTGRDARAGSMPATIEAQCAQMFRTVNDIVEAAGGTPANILKMTIWLRDAGNREALNQEWVKMFPDPESRPARHTFPLTGAGDALVQCDVTAVF
jgi:enamine deaminase RidA (YjgF/YER057c/UK114 family)